MRKILLFLLVPVSLFSQEDQWDAYIASYEKGAGSTLVNMSAKTNAPYKELKFVVITGVTFKGCSADGFPTQLQFPDLYRVADSVNNLLTAATETKHVGSFTYQCERLEYYYVKDTAAIRANLARLYKSAFPQYQPYINIRQDKNWQGYLEFLYPNEETLEYMGNQKVLLKLKEAGDGLDKPRKIDHWIYFKTEADRDCFQAYLKANNFSIENSEEVKAKNMGIKLRISRTDNVDLPSINKITLELKKEALKCRGDYDGWETFVVK